MDGLASGSTWVTELKLEPTRSPADKIQWDRLFAPKTFFSLAIVYVLLLGEGLSFRFVTALIDNYLMRSKHPATSITDWRVAAHPPSTKHQKYCVP